MDRIQQSEDYDFKFNWQAEKQLNANAAACVLNM